MQRAEESSLTVYVPVSLGPDHLAEKFKKLWENAYIHSEWERLWWETSMHTAGKGALSGKAMYLPLLLRFILLCLCFLWFPWCLPTLSSWQAGSLVEPTCSLVCQALHQGISCQPHTSSGLLCCSPALEAAGLLHHGGSHRFSPTDQLYLDPATNNIGNPTVKIRSFAQWDFLCVSSNGTISQKQHQTGEKCILLSLVFPYTQALVSWHVGKTRAGQRGANTVPLCCCWKLSLVASAPEVTLLFWILPPWICHSSFGGCLSIFLIGIW